MVSYKKERDPVFDVMKGIGIVFVVLGHIAKNYVGIFPLQAFIYSFHMPLFFFVSGMLYHKKEHFLKNISIKIGVPYICFALLSFVYWFLIESRYRSASSVDVLAQLINIVWPMNMLGAYEFNIVLWFLPALFFVQIFFLLISKICRGRKKILIAFFLLIVCYDAKFYDLFIPFYIPQALCAIPFFALGNAFWNCQYTMPVKYERLVLGVSFVVLLSLLFSPRYDMMHGSYHNHYALFAIGGGLGSLAIYFISKFIGKNKLLEWLGINSLTIMLIHEPVKRICLKIYSQITSTPLENVRTSVIHVVACCILTLCCVTPLVLAINKYVPFILGKKLKISFDEQNKS